MNATLKEMRFDLTSRLLHWLSAVIIIWAMMSGLSIVFFELDDSWRKSIQKFNVSITTLYIPFFCWRVAHMLRRCKPSYQNVLTPLQVRCACIAHMLIYVQVALVLVSGILMMDSQYDVFGLVVFEPIISEAHVQRTFAKLHHYCNYLLLVFVIGHVLAVVKHQLAGRAILKRML